MAKKKKKPKPENPTIFVFEGSIQHYEDGSMFNLKAQVTDDEWRKIVDETVRYKIFIECLKTVAFPILKEEWAKMDDWWRVQLEVAVGRMKELDPMVLIPIDQEAIRKQYSAKMTANAATVIEDIKQLRKMENPYGDFSQASVSAL